MYETRGGGGRWEEEEEGVVVLEWAGSLSLETARSPPPLPIRLCLYLPNGLGCGLCCVMYRVCVCVSVCVGAQGVSLARTHIHTYARACAHAPVVDPH